MDIDFSLILTLAVLVAGVLWGFDVLLLKPRRERRVAAAQAAALTQGSILPVATEVELLREPWLFETAHSFFPVLAVVWFLRSFIAEPFTIPSGSMLPSLQIGDYVLVNKFTYGVRLPVIGTQVLSVSHPKRGEVMVFRFPLNPSVNYIKRVVGLPGDTVESRNEVLYINGVEAPRVLLSQDPVINPWEQLYNENLSGHKHFVREEIDRHPAGTNWSHVIPAGEYFMMGDNRDNSNDSRFWGTVPEANIVGKAFYIWMFKKPGLNLPSFARNGAIE